MVCFFYIMVCFSFIVLQTSIMPHLSFSWKFYDILLPFVIYLGLKPVRESLPIVFIGGIVMDNLSGAPFGLYFFTYIWLFILVKWLMTFLHVNNFIVLPVLAGAGVLIENMIFFGTVTFLMPEGKLSVTAGTTVFIQLFWAVGTGALIVFLLSYTKKKWDKFVEKHLLRRAKNGN